MILMNWCLFSCPTDNHPVEQSSSVTDRGHFVDEAVSEFELLRLLQLPVLLDLEHDLNVGVDLHWLVQLLML